MDHFLKRTKTVKSVLKAVSSKRKASSHKKTASHKKTTKTVHKRR